MNIKRTLESSGEDFTKSMFEMITGKPLEAPVPIFVKDAEVERKRSMKPIAVWAGEDNERLQTPEPAE
jgi:hypothetical protein